ncbi:MAG: hypothetical protein CR991_11415 [Proteobacteria bacterium]|nr:MAG: hypothetical protein CR991_11415 [Pseudomonadota bacterium]
MDSLTTPAILEVQARGLHQYHKLEQFPVRIGRALDNDIILSDPTVSPYHLVIEKGQKQDELVLRNLSTENGSRLNQQVLNDAVVKLNQPLNLRLGTRRVRLLRTDTTIAPTSVRNCKGFYLLFCNPFSAIILTVLLGLAFAFEGYLQSYVDKEPIFYISGLMPYALLMITFTLLVAAVSRLFIQHWEVAAAASLVALFMLLPYLIGELGHFLNYLFTADWPLELLLIISNFILLPALLYMYIRMVHHTSFWFALGVALVISLPLFVYQAADLSDKLLIASEYSNEAQFNRTLSSFDIRLEGTHSLGDYMEQMSTALSFEADNKNP